MALPEAPQPDSTDSGDDVVSHDRLLPIVYEEMRRLAASYLRRERAGHTLQATALVHEAYLKLAAQRGVTWQNRAHFLGVAAQAMRRILADYARRRKAARRGGGISPVSLDEALMLGDDNAVAFDDLDQALDVLARIDERGARIVELRYFGGLTIEEVAEAMEISPATVKRDWAVARAWLYRELHGTPAPGT